MCEFMLGRKQYEKKAITIVADLNRATFVTAVRQELSPFTHFFQITSLYLSPLVEGVLGSLLR